MRARPGSWRPVGGLAPAVQPRALGDSAAVTSPLIPWNSGGAYIAATLGLATASCLPFAFLNRLTTFGSIAFAFLGLEMLRRATPPSRLTQPDTRQT